MTQPIGQTLKSAREKKGYSLEDVFSKTKIYSKVLKALEEDDFEHLSPTYIKGFLRQYGDFLGLDSLELLKTYQSCQTGPTAPLNQTPLKPIETPKPVDDRFWVSSMLKLVTVALTGIVILAALIWAGKGLVSLWHNQKKKTVSSTPAVRQTDSAKEANTIPFPNIGKNEPIRLEVRASNDSWIKLKIDGKLIFQGILTKGQVERWVAQDHFELRTGKAEMLNLIVNGQPLGAPGKGVLPKVLISRKGLQVVR